MTPEPTGGFYRAEGVSAFVRKFGYADKRGRVDRMNFGGIFRAGQRHATTKLTLELNGFNLAKGKIEDLDGSLALISDDDTIAAEWNFAALTTLWNKKHAQAVYVPAQTRSSPKLQYRYSPTVRFAEGTSIERFLTAVASGYAYYDPGIKLEQASTISPKTKRRSQFRISSRELSALYERIEQISVI